MAKKLDELKSGDVVYSAELMYPEDVVQKLATNAIVENRKSFSKCRFVGYHGHFPDWCIVSDEDGSLAIYHKTELRGSDKNLHSNKNA